MPSERPAARMLRSWWVLPCDERPHRVVGDEELEGRDHAAADAGDQPLRDDPGEARRELDADLVLALRGEHVGDAVERLGRVVGVQGANTRWPVSAIDSANCTVSDTHLTHEDHVGVFPRSTQGSGEAVGVVADLTLAHRRGLVHVHVLDGILDRDDVAAPVRVDVVDDRASEVELSEPVGPVTSTSPCGRFEKYSTAGGRPFPEGRQLQRDHPQRDREHAHLEVAVRGGSGRRRCRRTRSRPRARAAVLLRSSVST